MKEAAKIALGALVLILVLLALVWAGEYLGVDLMKEASGP